MADSKPPEISERDEAIIERHKKIKADYAPGTKLASEWAETTITLQTAKEIAETIVSSNILPPPDDNDVPVLVSLSSNVGLKEKVLAERLGKSYKVISGDLQKMRIADAPNPVILDASFLPVKPESIAAIIDFQGAIWHEAYHDLESLPPGQRTAENLLDIFARLRKSLKEGGVIIVDDPRYPPDVFKGTGVVKIDPLLRATGKEIEGFEVSTIGDGDNRLRVFNKVS